jgi:YHS domain-containing protein
MMIGKKTAEYFYFGIWLLPALMSCNQQAKQELKYISPAITAAKRSHAKFSLKDVDNKIDPSCMMPLTAGIGDTLHFHGLVLGFCSPECKKDFFTDPKGNLRLAQLKKIE